MLSKNSIISVLFLTVVWIVLREEFTLVIAGVGFALSIGCVYFCRRFLPLPINSDIKLFWFLVYIFFMAGQIYIGGMGAVKLLFLGAKAEIVQVKTSINQPLLRMVLMNSITLVPGTVSVDSEGDMITVLWLVRKNAKPEYLENAGEHILQKMERYLKRAEG